MTCAPSLTWVHVADSHMDEANGRQSRGRPAAIVAEASEPVGDTAHLVVLAGDDVHSTEPWPEHGIEGLRRGPNRNGKRW